MHLICSPVCSMPLKFYKYSIVGLLCSLPLKFYKYFIVGLLCEGHSRLFHTFWVKPIKEVVQTLRGTRPVVELYIEDLGKQKYKK